MGFFFGIIIKIVIGKKHELDFKNEIYFWSNSTNGHNLKLKILGINLNIIAVDFKNN